jgi:hypothetical protein
MASPVGLLATIAPRPPIYASAEAEKRTVRTAPNSQSQLSVEEIATYFQALAGSTPETRPGRLLL